MNNNETITGNMILQTPTYNVMMQVSQQYATRGSAKEKVKRTNP